ncbi:MAG: heme-binding domain-containing protein [Blastocatellia bacterium]
MLKVLKWSAIVAAVIFAAAQFIRPAKTNPPVEEARTLQAHLKVPPQVDGVFRRACYDCHSNETTWPWYSNIAPASWFLTDHVDHGRRHLNFSDWAQPDRHAADKGAAAQLDEICKEVKGRGMPLRSYLILHPGAELSDEDIKVICDWAESERLRLGFERARQAAAFD